MKNVLVIITDQQRYDTISCIGDSRIKTPNLDALARDSVVFERCITPSPVCVPARLSMLSGQYPARTGCNNNNAENVYRGNGFYSCLTEKGFRSCCVGKMHHLPDPYGSLGFEKRFTQEELSAPEDDYTRFIMEKYPWIYDYNGMRSEMYYVPQISPLPAYDHPTQWIGDRSVEYINEHDCSRPMLLVSSFIHPHPPFAPPAPWQKLYRDDSEEPYCPEDEDLESFWELLGQRCSCERLDMSRQDVLRMKNFYYSCVSFVDMQVGRIIDALKKRGMYDDTLIIFTSDHGDMMGDFKCVGKRSMVDPSCRVPLLIHYPGQRPEKRKDPCSLVDIAPTVLSYAGIDYERGEYDGVDLFHGELHEQVFSQFGCGKDGVYMVSDGKNKLVYKAGADKYFFFDTIPEQRDVYDSQLPEVKKLKPLLDEYRRSDKNSSVKSYTYEKYTRTHPHYPGRMDHEMRHAEEAAAVPEIYKIDL